MARTHERDIVNKLKDYLEKNFGNQVKVIGTRIGLWKFQELKQALPDPHPLFLHPDIDILLTGIPPGKNPAITGVEAKAIYLRGDTPNLKFYQGLDEAVALLRFGLDNVLFFQVFVVPLTDEKERDRMMGTFVEYPIPTRDIIRTLDLPISYTPAFDFVINNQLLEEPIQVLDLKHREEHAREEQLILKSNRRNPFLNSSLQYPTVIRKFLLDRFVWGHHGDDGKSMGRLIRE